MVPTDKNTKARVVEPDEYDLVADGCTPTDNDGSLDPWFDELYGCTDARKWATEFAKMVYVKPEIARDVGTMMGWFANAIMAGHDEGMKFERHRPLNDKIRELVFQAAGAAAGVCLPDSEVFPSEELTERVDQICADFGIPKERH
jgi:hypothetical protein